MQDTQFDVVIVGAGPAGCVLANRLTEDPGVTVALLEAGPDYGPDPAAWPAETNDPSDIWPDSHSWGYLHAGATPGTPFPLPRTRIVGGCSAINGSIWIRGSALDYDAWAALGNPGWSFRDLLPYFRRAEADALGGTLHGADGPVPITRVAAADFDPVERAFVAAAVSLGFAWTDDLNGDEVQRPGVGATPRNILAGQRMHAAITYLAPARSRPNLTIVPDLLVDRIWFAGKRAIGVRAADGREFRGRHVVLCAGSYGSPAILLRSGVGPAPELRRHGIPIVADLPGVGENLLDHPTVNFAVRDAFETFTIKPAVAPSETAAVTTLLKMRSGQTDEDTDVFIIHGQYFAPDRGRWVAWFLLNLEQTTSRGRVRLAARDPESTLDIDHAYVSDPTELEACCDGMELIRQLVATPPLAGMLEPIAGTAPTWRNRDELRRWIRNHVSTTYHPSSTCRMGPPQDPEAVVDTGAGSTASKASTSRTPRSSQPARAPICTAPLSRWPKNCPTPFAAISPADSPRDQPRLDSTSRST